MKNEIKNIITGTFKVEQGNLIQTTASFLEGSNPTGTKTGKSQSTKKEETSRLIAFIEANSLWFNPIAVSSRCIGGGAEQKVYLHKDNRNVLKFNTSIYYAKWLDYFKSLLLHNLLFPGTHYKLMGFSLIGSNLHAVVKQRYVVSSQPTDLEKVKKVLAQNSFINKKNNDYFNSEFGIILEDLHDENVLTNNGVLFFIDTVFFVKD